MGEFQDLFLGRQPGMLSSRGMFGSLSLSPLDSMLRNTPNHPLWAGFRIHAAVMGAVHAVQTLINLPRAGQRILAPLLISEFQQALVQQAANLRSAELRTDFESA